MKNFLREIILFLLKPFICIFLFCYYLRSFSLKVLQIIFILCLVCGCHNAIIKHQYLLLIIASCIGVFILSLLLFERLVHKHEYLMKKRNGVFIDNCDKKYENERTDEDTNVSAEEKSGVSLVLVSIGANKIAVLKEVREITGLDIKEAKNLIDAAPKIIKKNIKIEEAEEIKQKLEDAGAIVEIK